MKRLLLSLMLIGGMWTTQSMLPAQTSSQGSNYDPAPRRAPQTVAPAPPVEPEKPFELFNKLDWARKETWVKTALLLGSLLLALRAFRQLRD